MYIVKRIEAFLTGRKNRPSKTEIDCLSERYRNMILNDKAVELITKEDYGNLLIIAKHAEFGKSTAIQAAFCLGYEAGKAGQQNEEEN